MSVDEAEQPIGLDWGIGAIVTELRALREASLAQRRRSAKPLKLPSQKGLRNVVEQLTAALFPNRLGSRILANHSVDYFVGRLLDLALRELADEIELELQFATNATEVNERQRAEAVAFVGRFAAQLPKVRAQLETDIQAAYDDPAARSIDEVLVCYPGVTAVMHYRFAHVLYELGAPLVARIITELAHSQTGIDIHPGAKIGESFFIDHGTGVVIGETAVIGRRVRIDHGVTLGAKRIAADQDAAASSADLRHPIVEDDVVIYAGATLLGRITIGRGSVIGGNVWLTRSVPPGSNITQAQVRSEEFDAGSGI